MQDQPIFNGLAYQEAEAHLQKILSALHIIDQECRIQLDLFPVFWQYSVCWYDRQLIHDYDSLEQVKQVIKNVALHPDSNNYDTILDFGLSWDYRLADDDRNKSFSQLFTCHLRCGGSCCCLWLYESPSRDCNSIEINSCNQPSFDTAALITATVRKFITINKLDDTHIDEIPEKKFLNSFAKEIVSTLVQQAISQLKKNNGQSLLSGDDTGLRNTWEEICVQVRDEESLYWDSVYLPTIEEVLKDGYHQLDKLQKSILAFYLTNEMVDDEGSVNFNDDEVIDELKTLLLCEAFDYSNYRIEKYLYGEEEEEDEDLDEYDEDEEAEDGENEQQND